MSPWKLQIHPQQSWGHGETTLHSSAQTRGWIKTWKYQIFKGAHSPPWVTLWAPKNWVPALLRLTTSTKVVFSLGLTSEVSAGDLAKTGAKLVGKWGKWLLNEPLGYENGCRFIFYIFFVGWFFVFQSGARFLAICYILEQKPVLCWILELTFAICTVHRVLKHNRIGSK